MTKQQMRSSSANRVDGKKKHRSKKKTPDSILQIHFVLEGSLIAPGIYEVLKKLQKEYGGMIQYRNQANRVIYIPNLPILKRDLAKLPLDGFEKTCDKRKPILTVKKQPAA